MYLQFYAVSTEPLLSRIVITVVSISGARPDLHTRVVGLGLEYMADGR